MLTIDYFYIGISDTKKNGKEEEDHSWRQSDPILVLGTLLT